MLAPAAHCGFPQEGAAEEGGECTGQKTARVSGMCESKVYLATETGEELVLEDVTSIRPEGDGFRLVSLFGQQAHVRGRIREIDLLRHRVILEPAV